MSTKLIYTGTEFPKDTEDVVYIMAKVNEVWYRRKTEWLCMPYGPYKYLDEWER